MLRKISFFLILLVPAIHMFGQADLHPLERALSGIVTIGIFNTSENDLVMGFGQQPKTYAEMAYEQPLKLGEVFSTGSGFVVDVDGKYYVLTNAHVIDAASGQAGSMIAFSINREKYPLKLVGGDSFYDFAVLEFDGVAPGAEIQPLTFSPDEVRLVQKVFSIGNPLGLYPYTITEGIISGKNRLYHRPTTGRFGYLQHTAALIWGNSGGPLVDESGRVVGINTWIESRNKNGQDYLLSQLNFALEGQKARELLRDILANGGRVRRAFLGVEFAVKTDANGLQPDSPPFINSVFPGGPAYEALKERTGFTVTAINGQAVQTLQDIVRLLEATKPGDRVRLDLKKGMTRPRDSLLTTELTPERLEQIALHFFQRYCDYEVTEDANGVGMKGRSGKTNLRLEQVAADEKGTGAVFSAIQGKESYGLAGLGCINQQGQMALYHTTTLDALGAVIRLCTLEGHLGAGLVENGKYAGTVRFYMEDEDMDEIKVLFY